MVELRESLMDWLRGEGFTILCLSKSGVWRVNGRVFMAVRPSGVVWVSAQSQPEHPRGAVPFDLAEPGSLDSILAWVRDAVGVVV